jgi:hypothetical protein
MSDDFCYLRWSGVYVHAYLSMVSVSRDKDNTGAAALAALSLARRPLTKFLRGKFREKGWRLPTD